MLYTNQITKINKNFFFGETRPNLSDIKDLRIFSATVKSTVMKNQE
jgi:hypothetical protein